MTFTELRTLLDYHYWARDRLLDAVEPLTAEQFTRDMGNSFRSVRDALAHIYFAEWVWHSRWRGVSPTTGLPPDMFPDVATLRRIWGEHEGKVRQLLDELGDSGADRVMDYKLLNGQ